MAHKDTDDLFTYKGYGRPTTGAAKHRATPDHKPNTQQATPQGRHTKGK